MPLLDDTFYRRRQDIVAEMFAELQGIIPDVYLGDDGVISIIFTVESGQLENVYLANQLLAEDMFIHTASAVALSQFGAMYDLPIHSGTRSTGTVTFEGAGATYIPVGSQVAYDPGSGLDPVIFETGVDGTVPDPGDPDPPTVAVNAVAGNLNGTYEYIVTRVTSTGETLPSDGSATVNPVNQQVNVSAIAVGGPGCTGRNLYRDKNGAGNYRRIATLDNVVTTFTDNVTDATANTGASLPTVDNAHQITVDAMALDPGVSGNVAIGAVTDIVDAPAGLIGVTNPVAFTGGSDQEDLEDYRQRLLDRVRSPQTGSKLDIQTWAESVDGVESATVFPNDNMGTPTNGHVTVRISGPNGTIPAQSVIDATLAYLNSLGQANITYHVTTFTAVPTNVTVDVTLATGYAMADITTQVQNAVINYINNQPVGGTIYISGIVDAVFGLVGITDVVVTTPTSNQTATSVQKRTPGTISVV